MRRRWPLRTTALQGWPAGTICSDTVSLMASPLTGNRRCYLGPQTRETCEVAMVSLPKTMKAVLLTGYGGFEKLDYRTDVPAPRPGPDEVLIRVTAAGINNTDINTRIGWYSKAVSEGT